jgi:hypothetical protein
MRAVAVTRLCTGSSLYKRVIIEIPGNISTTSTKRDSKYAKPRSKILFTTAAGSSIGLTIPDACIQFCAHDDGRRNRLKHVEQFIEINS